MSEILIAGGGLAGGAAAAMLADAGRRVVVVERQDAPRDKICGEFLSTEAQAYLRAIGLDLQALGGAPISSVRLYSGRRHVEAKLPFVGLGLTRRRLDAALLDHAQSQGARIERGVSVRRVSQDGVQTDRGDLAASTVLLATGKHEVRGARRAVLGTRHKGVLGFKSYFRLSAPMRAALEGGVEITLFDGGYAGLQLVEGGLANLCLLVTRERFEAAGGDWPALLIDLLHEPHLAERLGDAQEMSPRPVTIADVPYGFIHRGSSDQPGLYRMGDQAAVIPSFCGDGMAIALHSAQLAARTILNGGSADAYHARLRADVTPQVRLAIWLQRRAEAWPGRGAVMLGLGLAPWALTQLAALTRVSRPPPRPSWSATAPAYDQLAKFGSRSCGDLQL